MLFLEPDQQGISWYDSAPDAGSGSVPFDAAQPLPPILVQNRPPEAVAYVLVNGGTHFTLPHQAVDPLDLTALDALAELDPDANPKTTALVRAGLTCWPEAHHELLCETALFAGLPEAARRYALPAEFAAHGILRYGGDGLFHAWAWQQAQSFIPGLRRLVSIHLNEAPNLAALRNGLPLETSLGFSIAEGIPSACASGSLDPGITLLLLEEGLDSAALQHAFTHEGGWQVLAGHPCNLATLLNPSTPAEAFARHVLIASLKKSLGVMLAALGGAEALLFASDDAPASAALVAELCRALSFAGLSPNEPTRLHNDAYEWSAPSSTLRAFSVSARRGDVLREVISLIG